MTFSLDDDSETKNDCYFRFTGIKQKQSNEQLHFNSRPGAVSSNGQSAQLTVLRASVRVSHVFAQVQPFY